MFKSRSNLVAAALSSTPTLRMSRMSIVAVTASVVMASSAFASALQDSMPPGKLNKPKAGIVAGDGSIVAGTGYSVSHDNTGQYTLDVPAGRFSGVPTGVTMDSSGHLFGTTNAGGANSNVDCPTGCGTAFKLSKNGDGSWSGSVLYSFCGLNLCTDGVLPMSPPFLDGAGNLIGTTSNYGPMAKAAQCSS